MEHIYINQDPNRRFILNLNNIISISIANTVYCSGDKTQQLTVSAEEKEEIIKYIEKLRKIKDNENREVMELRTRVAELEEDLQYAVGGDKFKMAETHFNSNSHE